MTGPDASYGLAAAAAAEQVRAAQRQLGCLIDDVEDVAERLRATTEIPWSGAAATAWRVRVDAARHDVAGGVRELGELHELLAALLQRLRE
ncbi:MAG: hypothetical protein ABR500_13325 [Dermatophilaceae bacterium]